MGTSLQPGSAPMPAPPSGPAGALLLQFLAWLDQAPRSYGETMGAWRSHCPRLSVWEDAVADDLVRIERRAGDSWVHLTPRGRALLHGA